MFKRLIKISLLMSFSILSINSCTKIIEDNNPTNGRTTAIFMILEPLAVGGALLSTIKLPRYTIGWFSIGKLCLDAVSQR